MRASSGSVALINPTNGFWKSRRRPACRPTPPKSGCASARASPAGWRGTGKPARVGDVRQRPALRHAAARMSAPNWPCRWRCRGEVRGVLNVDADQTRTRSAPRTRNCWRNWRRRRPGSSRTPGSSSNRASRRACSKRSSASAARINSALNVNEALQLITREACVLMEARPARS